MPKASLTDNITRVNTQKTGLSDNGRFSPSDIKNIPSCVSFSDLLVFLCFFPISKTNHTSEEIFSRCIKIRKLIKHWCFCLMDNRSGSYGDVSTRKVHLLLTAFARGRWVVGSMRCQAQPQGLVTGYVWIVRKTSSLKCLYLDTHKAVQIKGHQRNSRISYNQMNDYVIKPPGIKPYSYSYRPINAGLVSVWSFNYCNPGNERFIWRVWRTH